MALFSKWMKYCVLLLAYICSSIWQFDLTFARCRRRHIYLLLPQDSTIKHNEIFHIFSYPLAALLLNGHLCPHRDATYMSSGPYLLRGCVWYDGHAHNTYVTSCQGKSMVKNRDFSLKPLIFKIDCVLLGLGQ